MPKQSDPNPYAPTRASSTVLREADEFPRERLAAGIRSTSRLALCSGVFFLSAAISLPYVLRWQAENTLRPFGAEKYIDMVVAREMERIGSGQIVTGIGAVLCIAAGLLMRRHAAPGLYLLMLVCAALLGEIVIAVVMHAGDISVPGIIRGVWWAVVLSSAIRTNKYR
jgi:hypothetical protein